MKPDKIFLYLIFVFLAEIKKESSPDKEDVNIPIEEPPTKRKRRR